MSKQDRMRRGGVEEVVADLHAEYDAETAAVLVKLINAPPPSRKKPVPKRVGNKERKAPAIADGAAAGEGDPLSVPLIGNTRGHLGWSGAPPAPKRFAHRRRGTW